jgi:hypothetical protein
MTQPTLPPVVADAVQFEAVVLEELAATARVPAVGSSQSMSLAVQATLCARTWDSHYPLVHWPLVRTATSHKHSKCHAVAELQFNIAKVAHTRPGVAASTHDKASTHGMLGPHKNITAPANTDANIATIAVVVRGRKARSTVRGRKARSMVTVLRKRRCKERSTLHTTTREREVHGGDKECAFLTSELRNFEK